MGFSIPRNGEGHGIIRRWWGARSCAPVSVEAPVVAITSGKGGTGKSFIATNAAVALGRRGRRIVLVDCDYGLGNAHLLLGVNPRWTLQHVLERRASIEDVVLRTPYGIDLVPAGSGISHLADLSEQELLLLAHALSRLAASHDALILDTAAGISAQSLLTLLAASQVVLVTNPEIAALTDAYALIKCLARQPSRPPIRVVVNRVTRRGLGVVTFDKLANVSGRFAGCRVHYLGEVADDAAVTQRRLGQPPLIASHPECETAQCITEIVENLLRGTGGLCPQSAAGRSGLMQRFRTHLDPAPHG